ncbi:hypothetical protein LTR53_019335, partial [Teratosphaeriaceae sp. CCFEE 6253]
RDHHPPPRAHPEPGTPAPRPEPGTATAAAAGTHHPAPHHPGGHHAPPAHRPRDRARALPDATTPASPAQPAPRGGPRDRDQAQGHPQWSRVRRGHHLRAGPPRVRPETPRRRARPPPLPVRFHAPSLTQPTAGAEPRHDAPGGDQRRCGRAGGRVLQPQ